MPVNRNFWSSYFVMSKTGVPPYRCPICHHGTLKLVGDILQGESRHSVQHLGDGNPDQHLGAFCCLLHCDNVTSGE